MASKMVTDTTMTLLASDSIANCNRNVVGSTIAMEWNRSTQSAISIQASNAIKYMLAER